MSVSDAAAVLVLHPESPDSNHGSAHTTVVSTSAGSLGERGDYAGPASLKMQTLMALSSLLLGRKAPVVVQVGLPGLYHLLVLWGFEGNVVFCFDTAR